MKKERIYTEQQETFFNALPKHKGDIRAAMDEAGYSKNVSINYMVKTFNDEIIEIAKNLLAGNSVKAVSALVGVIDDKGTAVGSNNIINAAKALLDKAGAARVENSLSVDVGAGLIILPAKQKENKNEMEG